MRIFTYLMPLCLFFLMGCSDPDNAEVVPKPTVVNFVVINEGSTTGIKADMTSVYKLDTPQSWQKFWTEHTQYLQPAPAAPEIDFSKDMVLAIVDNDQPSSGYQFSVEELQIVDDKLYVFATRKQPGAGCVSLGMISQPFIIVQVQKSDLVPELRLTTVSYPCE